MNGVTAKVKLVQQQKPGGAGPGSTTLGFGPNYGNGTKNEAWAAATPAINLTMTVKDEVGDQFESGKAYDLLITEDPDQSE